MEYTFSYSKKEMNRLLEYPFQYKSLRDMKIYDFHYNKNGIIVDTRFFDDSVAANKVATESTPFKLDLFQKIKKNTIEFQKRIKFSYHKDVLMLPVNNFVTRLYIKNSKLNTLDLIYKDISHDMHLYKWSKITRNVLLKGFYTQGVNLYRYLFMNLDEENIYLYRKVNWSSIEKQFTNLQKPDNNLNIYLNYYNVITKKYFDLIYSNEAYYLEKTGNDSLNIYDSFLNLEKSLFKKAYIEKQIHLHNTASLGLNILENIFSNLNDDKTITIQDTVYYLKDFNKNLNIYDNKNFFIPSETKYTNNNYNIIFIKDNQKHMYHTKFNDFFNKTGLTGFYDNFINNSIKNINARIKYDEFIDFGKVLANSKIINYEWGTISFSKYTHNIIEYDNKNFLERLYYHIQQTDNNYFIEQSKRKLFDQKDQVQIYLDKKKILRDQAFLYLEHERRSFILTPSLNKSLFKEKYKINPVNNFKNLKKKSFKLYLDSIIEYKRHLHKNIVPANESNIYNVIFVNKREDNTNLYNKFEANVIKEDSNISKDILSDNMFLFKSLLPTALNNKKHTIVSLNKNSNRIFNTKMVSLLKESKKFDKITKDSFTSKMPQITMLDDIHFLCDKLIKNSNFITILNDLVLKNKIKINYYNKDININKNKINIKIFKNIFINKNKKDLKKFFNLEISKVVKQSTRHKDEFIQLVPKDIFRTNWIRIIKEKIPSVFYDLDWFTSYRGVYLNQDIFTFRQLYDIFFNELDGFKVEKPTEWFEKLNSFEVKKFLTYNKKDDHIFRESPFNLVRNKDYLMGEDLTLNLFDDFDGLLTTIREANISTDPITDWAWVYEEEEPFDDPYKIDELLLPENDTRYEDFEDIIFNKETGRPRRPVEIIDDHTFIAKFPNHYPIKNNDGTNAYENVALEYLDVRTAIMKDVFIEFHKLWQDHIFDFARMTIPQSAKKILDYLYADLLVKFPEKDLPEAFRVFRQIRWYLEQSIIQDSEYYITYVPGNLESGPMNTSELNMPTSLTNSDNDYEKSESMYIDTDNHVIRNNPDMLNKPAYINFYIENEFETTISFSLNTFTPVYIKINGEIIEKHLSFNGKLVYNIPYTEEMNTFTIEKLSADNTDIYFFIGNIKIANMGKDGELTINFEPKLWGNKVLNNVSKRILTYINLYEDNEEIIKAVLKGNAHLSDVYDKLVEYWELHWQNKDKGKRLTIKRT